MKQINAIPNREEISQEYKWATEDLFPSDESWEQELSTIAEDKKTLVAFAGRLGESGETLCAYLENMERVDVKAALLGSYCMRKSDEDTRVA